MIAPWIVTFSLLSSIAWGQHAGVSLFESERLAWAHLINADPSTFDLELLDQIGDTIRSLDFFSQLGQELPFLNSSIPAVVGNLSTRCMEDMLVLGIAADKAANKQQTDLSMILLDMIDASGRRSGGILHGALTFFGFKQECDTINHFFPDRTRPLTTMYSRAFMNIGALLNVSILDTCSGLLSFKFDLCMPTSCRSHDLEFIMRYAISMTSNISSDVLCEVKTMDDLQVPYNFVSVLVGIILVFFILLVLFAGLLDYYGAIDRKNPKKSIRGLMCFSIYTNTAELFKTGKPRPGQISTINCIRSWTMIWIIIFHVFLKYGVYSENPLDAETIIKYFFTELLVNPSLAVASFFFMGGIMVSYSWFRAFNKDRGLLRDGRQWTMFYVHRFLRLSAPYYAFIFFYTFLLLPYMSKSVTFFEGLKPADGCRERFWTNLLYINNYFTYDVTCLDHTWYLAVDMQMYILSPLVLIPLAINAKLGLCIAALIWTLSTALNIFLVYANDFAPSSMPHVTGNITEIPSTGKYYFYQYEATWIRCQIYIQGLVVGWFLQRCKTAKIPPFVDLVGWLASLGLMFTVLFGLYNYNTGGEMNIFWRAMYSAFNAAVWGAGLSWIVISAFYGGGGIANRFMSWSLWDPVGKLTYCTYLVHYQLIDYYMSRTDNPIYVVGIWNCILWYGVPLVVISLAFGYAWSMLFEVPLGKLEALLLVRGPATKKTIVEKLDSKAFSWNLEHNTKQKIEDDAGQRR